MRADNHIKIQRGEIMGKGIRKLFVSILAITIIFTSMTPVLASKITVNMPSSIYETTERNNISSGVVHEKIMRFTTSGWWNINVLRINLSDPYTEIKGLYNPVGIPNRDKVSTLVEKHNAVAGINGDFFNYAPLPHSMGTLINNGEMVSSPIEESYSLPSFFIDILNRAKIDYVQRSMNAINRTQDKTIIINTINKVTPNFNSVTLLDKLWGTKSIGNRFHDDLIEVVVDNNIVTDVRVGKDAVDIPANGYVLAIRGPRTQGLEKFSIGDIIDLDITTSPGMDSIKFAIGGGSIILKNGQLSITNINVKGNEPRTGIGISKNGKEIILVTIDGRDTSFKGVSQEMFGAILRDLGAYNGLNLDGGGSTTMAIKPIDQNKAAVVNKPSDGSERLVVNSVGVFSNAPIGDLSYIKLSTDDNTMFTNGTRRFTVKGYDKHHNPVKLDATKLEFSHKGVKGTIEGNSFKAEEKGNAKITAKYGTITDSLNLQVLGKAEDITTNLTNFNIDNNSERRLPMFYGKDQHGYEARIYPEDISYKVINKIGYVVDNIFYSEEHSAAGILTAEFGHGVENIIVSVGNVEKLIEEFDTLDNLGFNSYPATVLGDIGLSLDKKQGDASLSLKYDFSLGENTRAAYLEFIKDEELGLAIEGSPKKLGLWVNGDSSGSWLRSTIKDNEGNTHNIDFTKAIDWTGWQYVTADIPATVKYPLSLERIYVVEIDSLKKQSGEILLDGLTALYPPVLSKDLVIPTPTTLTDNKNIKVDRKKDGFTFVVGAEPTGINKLLGYDANKEIKAKTNKHRIAVFLNGLSDEFRIGMKNTAVIDASGPYNRNKHRDVYFLHVNTEKSGIRATNSGQWKTLISDLKTRKEKNIVLFLSSPVFSPRGFTDVLEANLLHKHLVEARGKDRNIFVVQGSDTNSTDLKDGIRYIRLNTVAPTKPEDIYNLSIIEFVVNGSDISYEINPLFERPK